MEDKQIQTTDNKDPRSISIKYEVAGSEVELSINKVRKFLVGDNNIVTDQEVGMFINLCKYQKLNPFIKEAYLVKYKSNNPAQQKPAQLIVSFDAYRRKADENPNFEGYEAGLIIKRGEEILEVEGSFKLTTDVLLGGWCKVYRKGRKPYTAKVSTSEYHKQQSTWNSMPCTMIRKTAIVQALREAFPNDFNGMYIEEEIKDIDTSKFSVLKQEIDNSIDNMVDEEEEVLDFEETEYQDVEEVSDFD